MSSNYHSRRGGRRRSGGRLTGFRNPKASPSVGPDSPSPHQAVQVSRRTSRNDDCDVFNFTAITNTRVINSIDLTHKFQSCSFNDSKAPCTSFNKQINCTERQFNHSFEMKGHLNQNYKNTKFKNRLF